MAVTRTMGLLKILVILSVGLRALCHETFAEDASPKSFRDFVAESLVKSVVHGITKELKERLNAAETKLEVAMAEIKKLKAKDQDLADELSRLRSQMETLCKLEPATSQTTPAQAITSATQTATFAKIESEVSTDGRRPTVATELYDSTTSGRRPVSATVKNAGSSTTQTEITSAAQATAFTNIESLTPTEAQRLTAEPHSSVNTTKKTPATSPVNISSCALDVMYVLDGSGSVGITNFTLMKQWVKMSAQHLIDQHPLIQLGVMQYSHYYDFLPIDDPRQIFIQTFVELANRNYSDFASAVDEIPLFGYTTYTAAALRHVKMDFVNSENFNQTGNVQVMIVVIDGNSDDSYKLDQSAADLREIGVIPFSIGVGEVSVPELRTIATGNLSSSDRVTTISYFSDLQTVQLDLSSYLTNC